MIGEVVFSTALRATRLCVREEGESDQVCLKVIKNNKDYLDQSLGEIQLLMLINGKGDPDEDRFLKLVDFFYFKEHLFIVTELLKENLYEFSNVVKKENLLPFFTLPRIAFILEQVLRGLAYIHSLDIIHCDIKPENVVLEDIKEVKVKLIDFGSSCFTSDALTSYVQSRSYRAPEVILGCPYDQRIDVWSLGAVTTELLTSNVLFENDSIQGMLAKIQSICGPFPPALLQTGSEVSKYMTPSGDVYEYLQQDDPFFFGFQHEDDDLPAYVLLHPKKTTWQARAGSEDSEYLSFV
jgi:serine/threonine protein kinase